MGGGNLHHVSFPGSFLYVEMRYIKDIRFEFALHFRHKNVPHISRYMSASFISIHYSFIIITVLCVLGSRQYTNNSSSYSIFWCKMQHYIHKFEAFNLMTLEAAGTSRHLNSTTSTLNFTISHTHNLIISKKILYMKRSALTKVVGMHNIQIIRLKKFWEWRIVKIWEWLSLAISNQAFWLGRIGLSRGTIQDFHG